MTLRYLATLFAAIPLGTSAHAATLSGDLTSDGKPLRGALVTLISADKLTSETVLTAANGHYTLGTALSGALTLRGRAPLSADATAEVKVPVGAQNVMQSLTLRRLTTPQANSDSLPASAHFSNLKFPTLIQRQQFQTDCLSCREIGNPLTRTARPIAAWQAYLTMMTGFAGYTSKVHVDDYAAALNAAFTGTPMEARENTTVDQEALTARITEWKLPTAQLAHDTEVYPPDGKFYTTDEFVDQ